MSSSQPFRWPPKSPAPEPSTETPSSHPSSPQVAPPPQPTPYRDTIWRHVERTWLGLVREPLADRLAAAQWAPDAPGDYCPSCGRSVGPHELILAEIPKCPACETERWPWQRFIRLGPYEDPLRETIHDLKFTAFRAAGHALGKRLGQILLAHLEAESVDPRTTILTGVPTSMQHRVSRGIDHTAAIVRGISSETGCPTLRLLARRHRPAQFDVPMSERVANVRGVFRPARPLPEWAGLVVLVDDIRTSGATLRSAARTLQPSLKSVSGASIPLWVTTVAVADGYGGRRRAAAAPSRATFGPGVETLSPKA